MRLIHTAPLAAAILLAACGGDADTNEDGEVSGAEAAAEAAGAVQPQPGQYRTAFELLEFNVPDAPEALRQQLQAKMGGAAEVAKPIVSCLTPEQAAANGAEQMVKNMTGNDCTIARFDVSGGTLSAETQCPGPNGTTSHSVLDGQMTATSSTMTMTTETEMQGLGKVQMKVRVNSERVGDCPA